MALLPVGTFQMDRFPAGITADSRRVKPGMVYVAIAGPRMDGHAFLQDALHAGAAAFLVEDPASAALLPEDAPIYLAPSTRNLYPILLRAAAGEPDRDLTLAGVTGTNGKTTTAYLVHELLCRLQRRGTLLSTVEFRTPETVQAAGNTTPGPEQFYNLLKQTVAEGGDFVSMELSSHALDQHRTDGVQFTSAVFTNFTGDHLDYHKTMEHYFASKRRLFTEMLSGTAIINIDDAAGRLLAEELPGRCVTFGTAPEADCRIFPGELTASGSTFALERGGCRFALQTRLNGLYNLYNLTGALLSAECCGARWQDLMPLVPECRPAPGRLEALEVNGVTFFVDYAHTDDALTQALRGLRTFAPRRILTVFGCGGDRDRTKRPRMGNAAAQYSDLLIVTSDNPRSEDPLQIIAEIRAGIPDGTACHVEVDRAAAIRLAYQLAEPGDVVLVAGKGHEDYQEINGIRHPFDDRAVIRGLQ